MCRAIIPTLIAGLVLAACSSVGDSDGTSTTSAVVATTSTVAETTTSVAEPTTTVSRPVATTTTTATGGDDCLVGTWVLDNDVHQRMFAELLVETGLGATEVINGGSYTVDQRADGTLRIMYDNWQVSVATPDRKVTSVSNGEATGTWSADDGTSTTTVTDDSGVTHHVEVDGEKATIPAWAESLDISSMVTVEYSCSGEALVFSFEGSSWVMNRG